MAAKTMPATVRFESTDTMQQVLPGESLLDCARRTGVKISSVCGGRGICKSCIVRFTEGQVPTPSQSDRQFFSVHKLKQGWRRACQVLPDADCGVYVPARSRAESVRHQYDAADFWIQPDPAVHTFRVALTPPSLEDPRADVQRLMEEVTRSAGQQCHSMDYALMRQLPKILRDNNWSVQVVVRFGEIIAVQPGQTCMLGLAVDVGTTNIGVFLIDLRKGTVIASDGLENPQAVHGGDVITRITVAKQSPDIARDMQALTVKGLNELVRKLCENHNLLADQIVDVVLAGNTVMHHLFLGLSVDTLGVAPFIAVACDAVDIKARELKLITAPGSYVHFMKNIAGYVGGDHTAMLLGIRADEEVRTVVALDIGTNTEISLIHDGQLSCLSCPSGPALEGGHITSGMRAAIGAIEGVAIRKGKLELKIIGDGPAIGLCGSAVVDTTATFYQSGGITEKGRIVKGFPLATDTGEQRLFVLQDADPKVVFTQDDIRAVQLAKGAIRAGIEILLEEAGLVYEQVDKIIIAGAFGAYIDVENARVIGMFPDLPLDRFEQVGNAAGTGVQLALLSYPLRIEAQSLASKSNYLELAGSRHFTSRFIEHINFPKRESIKSNSVTLEEFANNDHHR